MIDANFRTVTDDDVSAILCIYNYYVLNSTATFSKHPLSLQEMAEILFFQDPRFQTFVISTKNEILGYCSIKPFHPREAYNNTGEVAIYLNPAEVHKGLGSKALDFLEEFARANGFHVLIACITAENEASIRLFEGHQYTQCGHFKEVGRKFGRWLDVEYWQKIL